MFIYFKRKKANFFYCSATRLITFVLSFSLVLGPSAVNAQYLNFLNLPFPGSMVPLSPAFTPVLLKGMTIHPNDPLKFDFIIDSGSVETQDLASLREESERLVKYFLASMTVPKDDLWVNLSPYEEDRIIPEQLGKTELGRDMLAQDYLLKQLTASLMYPEEELGKAFWDKIYRQAQEQFGTSEIPVNTFNKVWILPETATVYEHEQTVYVVDTYLKVMLDSDYQAMNESSVISHQESSAISRQSSENELKIEDKKLTTEDRRLKADNLELSEQIIREIIVPAIEQEVNTGKHFAPLRQIYHSLILAKWYKETIKNSLLSKVYADQNLIDGVDIEDTNIKDKIYDQYMEAYKKGVFNYIKEDYVAMESQQDSTATSRLSSEAEHERNSAKEGAPARDDRLSQEMIPRKYFSGGIPLAGTLELSRSSSPIVGSGFEGSGYKANVKVKPERKGSRVKDQGSGISVASSSVTSPDSIPRDFHANLKQILAQGHWPESVAETLIQWSNRYGLKDRISAKNLSVREKIDIIAKFIREEASVDPPWSASPKKIPNEELAQLHKMPINKRRANCDGFSCMFDALGKAAGLSVDVMFVYENKQVEEAYHGMNMVTDPSSGLSYIVDLAVEGDRKYIVSKGFMLDDFYEQINGLLHRRQQTKNVDLFKIPETEQYSVDFNRSYQVLKFATGANSIDIVEEFDGMKSGVITLINEVVVINNEVGGTVAGDQRLLEKYIQIEAKLREALEYLETNIDALEARWEPGGSTKNRQYLIGLNDQIQQEIQFARLHVLIHQINEFANDHNYDRSIPELERIVNALDYLAENTSDSGFRDKVIGIQSQIKGRIKKFMGTKLRDRLIDAIGQHQEFGEAYRIDWNHGPVHARHLWDHAIKIAREESISDEVDWEVLAAAIVLHDIFVDLHREEHPAKAAQFAEEYLPQFGFDEARIQRIQTAILLHDKKNPADAGERMKAGLEAQLLYDVDNLDPLGIKVIAHDPAFPLEVTGVLLDALKRMALGQDQGRNTVYLRTSSLAIPSRELLNRLRQQKRYQGWDDDTILESWNKERAKGGYRLVDYSGMDDYRPGHNVANIIVSGVMWEEALAVSDMFREAEDKIYVNVIVISSPDQVIGNAAREDGYAYAKKLVPKEERHNVPTLTDADTSPFTLAGVGDILGLNLPVINLGVRKISRSTREVGRLRRHHGHSRLDILNALSGQFSAMRKGDDGKHASSPVERQKSIADLLEEFGKEQLEGLNITKAAKLIGIRRQGLSRYLNQHDDAYDLYGIKRPSNIGKLLEQFGKEKLEGLSAKQVSKLIKVSQSGVSRYLSKHDEAYDLYGIKRPSHIGKLLKKFGKEKLEGLSANQVSKLIKVSQSGVSRYLSRHDEAYDLYGIKRPSHNRALGSSSPSGASSPVDLGNQAVKRAVLEAYDQEGLAALIDRDHAGRMAEYAVAIAKQMELSELDQDLVWKAGLMHDLGRRGVDFELGRQFRNLGEAVGLGSEFKRRPDDFPESQRDPESIIRYYEQILEEARERLIEHAQLANELGIGFGGTLPEVIQIPERIRKNLEIFWLHGELLFPVIEELESQGQIPFEMTDILKDVLLAHSHIGSTKRGDVVEFQDMSPHIQRLSYILHAADQIEWANNRTRLEVHRPSSGHEFDNHDADGRAKFHLVRGKYSTIGQLKIHVLDRGTVLGDETFKATVWALWTMQSDEFLLGQLNFGRDVIGEPGTGQVDPEEWQALRSFMIDIGEDEASLSQSSSSPVEIQDSKQSPVLINKDGSQAGKYTMAAVIEGLTNEVEIQVKEASLPGEIFSIDQIYEGSRINQVPRSLVQVVVDTVQDWQQVQEKFNAMKAQILDSQDITTVESPADEAYPDDFIITGNLETWVRRNGVYQKLINSEMDGSIRINPNGSAQSVRFRHAKQGDIFVTGRRGVEDFKLEAPEGTEAENFAFMDSGVTSERPSAPIVDSTLQAIWDIKFRDQDPGKVMAIGGTAVGDPTARRDMQWLIENGMIDVLVVGAEMIKHDLEAGIFGTSKGRDIVTGEMVDDRDELGIEAINAVRETGSLEHAVQSGLIRDGILYSAVRQGIELVVITSIDDDYVIPEAIANFYEAQDAIRNSLEGVEVQLMLASTLVSIATGNISPASVYQVIVDKNQAVPAKAGDRGSSFSAAVMDVAGFLHNLKNSVEHTMRQKGETVKELASARVDRSTYVSQRDAILSSKRPARDSGPFSVAIAVDEHEDIYSKFGYRLKRDVDRGRVRITEKNIYNNQSTPTAGVKKRKLVQIDAPNKATLVRVNNVLEQINGKVLDGDDVVVRTAIKDGAFPKFFAKMKRLESWVRYQGDWIKVNREEEKAGIRIKQRGSEIIMEPVSPDEVQAGDLIVVGRTGIEEFSPESPLSSEGNMPVVMAAQKAAQATFEARHGENKGDVIFAFGPAVNHSAGARDNAQWLLQNEAATVLTGGNALEVHDVEGNIRKTSLGMSMKTGAPTPHGHEKHLRTINELRQHNGAVGMVQAGLLTGGMVWSAIKKNIKLLFLGSIRDDGPSPDTVVDAIEAQRKMREYFSQAKVAILVGSRLHSEAANKFLPADALVVNVDIYSPSIVDSEPGAPFIGLETDAETFLQSYREEYERLLSMAQPGAASSPVPPVDGSTMAREEQYPQKGNQYQDLVVQNDTPIYEKLLQWLKLNGAELQVVQVEEEKIVGDSTELLKQLQEKSGNTDLSFSNIPKSLLVEDIRENETIIYMLVVPIDSRVDRLKVESLIGNIYSKTAQKEVELTVGYPKGKVTPIPLVYDYKVNIIMDSGFRKVGVVSIPSGQAGKRFIVRIEDIVKAIENSGIHTVRFEAIKISNTETLGDKESGKASSPVAQVHLQMTEHLSRLQQLVDTADVVSALTLEVLLGRSNGYKKPIHDLARPHQGQMKSAENIRALIADSGYIDIPLEGHTGQDAYSLRAIPQVHGATRDSILYLKHLLNEISNSTGEGQESINLVLVGNSLRIAVSELADISERRINRLINPALSRGLPAFLTDSAMDGVDAGLNSTFMIPQYAAAAVVEKLRAMAYPVSSLDIDSEFLIIKHISEVIDLVEEVLAIELMVAAQAADIRLREEEKQLGMGSRQAHKLVRNVVNHVGRDRIIAPDIRAIKTQIEQGEYSQILRDLVEESEIDFVVIPPQERRPKEFNDPIELDGVNAVVDDIGRIAVKYSEAIVPERAMERVQRSNEIRLGILESDRRVYGVNTGFGSNANIPISPDELAQLQENLIRSHASGVGKHLDKDVVRALMAANLNKLATSYSGVRPEVLEVLSKLLNSGIIPVVPGIGSVGASGDLAPLSHVALTMMGEGDAYYEGELMKAKKALERAGIKPLKLEAKEGLSLNNGTGLMVAFGVLNILRLQEMHQRLIESKIEHYTSHQQKTISSYLNYASMVLNTEINSATDNPLIINGEIYNGANFHGQPVAVTLDVLRSVVLSLANIIVKGKLNSNVQAQAILEDIRSHSHPATVGNIPTSNDQEDHNSYGATAGLLLHETMFKLEELESLSSSSQAGDTASSSGSSSPIEGQLTIIPKTTTQNRHRDFDALVELPQFIELIRSGGLDLRDSKEHKVVSIGAGLLPFDAKELYTVLGAHWKPQIIVTELPSAYSSEHIVIDGPGDVEAIKKLAKEYMEDTNFVPFDDWKEVRLVVSDNGSKEDAGIVEIYAGFVNPATGDFSYRYLAVSPNVKFFRRGEEVKDEKFRHTKFFRKIIGEYFSIDGLVHFIEQGQGFEAALSKAKLEQKPVEAELAKIGARLLLSADMTSDPTLIGSVSLITAHQVLEHMSVDQLTNFLLMAERALSDGGILVSKNPLKGVNFNTTDKLNEIHVYQKQEGSLVYLGSLLSDVQNKLILDEGQLNQAASRFHPNPLIDGKARYLFGKSGSSSPILDDHDVDRVLRELLTSNPKEFEEIEAIEIWDGKTPLNEVLNDSEGRQVIALFGEPDDTGTVKNMGNPGDNDPDAVFAQLFDQLQNEASYENLKIVYLGNIILSEGDPRIHRPIREEQWAALGKPYYDNVADNYERVTNTVRKLLEINPELTIINIGGDNGYSFANAAAFQGTKALVALDPHLDARTKRPGVGNPRLSGSHSGTYVTDLIESGEVLTSHLSILGVGPYTEYYPHRRRWLISQGVDPENLVNIGDVQRLIREGRWSQFVSQKLNTAKKAADYLHVMLDMDVVNEDEAPGVSARNTKGGISGDDFIAMALMAGKNGASILDLMEVSSSRDADDQRTVKLAARAVNAFLQGRNEFVNSASSPVELGKNELSMRTENDTGKIVRIDQIDHALRDKLIDKMLTIQMPHHKKNRDSGMIPFTRTTLMDMMKRSSAHKFSYAYFDNDQLLGFFLSELYAPNVVRSLKMYTHPDHRSHGIGTKLFSALAKDASAAGISEIRFRVTKGNIRAQNLYSRLGFINKGEIIYDLSKAGEYSYVKAGQKEKSGEIRGYLFSGNPREVLRNIERSNSRMSEDARAFLPVDFMFDIYEEAKSYRYDSLADIGKLRTDFEENPGLVLKWTIYHDFRRAFVEIDGNDERTGLLLDRAVEIASVYHSRADNHHAIVGNAIRKDLRPYIIHLLETAYHFVRLSLQGNDNVWMSDKRVVLAAIFHDILEYSVTKNQREVVLKEIFSALNADKQGKTDILINQDDFDVIAAIVYERMTPEKTMYGPDEVYQHQTASGEIVELTGKLAAKIAFIDHLSNGLDRVSQADAQAQLGQMSAKQRLIFSSGVLIKVIGFTQDLLTNASRQNVDPYTMEQFEIDRYRVFLQIPVIPAGTRQDINFLLDKEEGKLGISDPSAGKGSSPVEKPSDQANEADDRVKRKYSKFSLHKTILYIEKLFIEDKGRTQLPTQRELSDALGSHPGIFSRYSQVILIALKKRIAQDDYDEELKERIEVAISRFGRILPSVRQSFQKELEYLRDEEFVQTLLHSPLSPLTENEKYVLKHRVPLAGFSVKTQGQLASELGINHQPYIAGLQNNAFLKIRWFHRSLYEPDSVHQLRLLSITHIELDKHNIATIAQLIEIGVEGLRKKGINDRRISEIKRALAEKGLWFDEEQHRRDVEYQAFKAIQDAIGPRRIDRVTYDKLQSVRIAAGLDQENVVQALFESGVLNQRETTIVQHRLLDLQQYKSTEELIAMLNLNNRARFSQIQKSAFEKAIAFYTDYSSSSPIISGQASTSNKQRVTPVLRSQTRKPFGEGGSNENASSPVVNEGHGSRVEGQRISRIEDRGSRIENTSSPVKVIVGKTTEASDSGSKTKNEDRHVNTRVGIEGLHRHGQGQLMAVMDGRWGIAAVEQVRKSLLRVFVESMKIEKGDVKKALARTYSELDAMTSNKQSGTTVTISYVPDDEQRVYWANLGDGIVIIKNNEGDIVRSKIHNMKWNEAELTRALQRGESRGAYVNDSGYITLGTLRGTHATRFLGAKALEAIVSRTPDIGNEELGENSYFLLATDGVYKSDIKSADDIFSPVEKLMEESSVDADSVVHHALKHRTGDNVTVVTWRSASSPVPIVPNDERRATNNELGGIDMNDITVDRQGAGVQIEFDPVEIQAIIDRGITGFSPVIINMVPLPSVLPLLGLAPRDEEEEYELSQLN